jgi:D-xylose transport system permease protein
MNPIKIKQLFTQFKILALLFAIALIWAFFSWKTEGGFVSPRNLSNLVRQMAITGILACGMVFVIIAGEIDLSVGSLLGLLGGVAAVLDVSHHMPLPLIVVLVLACGLLLGIFNGYLVAYAGIPSFIVGLGGMLAYRGIVLGVTDGVTVAPVSPDMVLLGQGYLSPTLGVGLGVVLFVLAA